VASRVNRPTVATRAKEWVVQIMCCLRYVLIPRTNPSSLEKVHITKPRGGVGLVLYAGGSERLSSLSVNAVMPLDVLGRTRATLTGPTS
jgi:hypothetical protein